MAQSSAEENARLKQALEEKSQLVERQSEIINRQIDIIEDTSAKLIHAETLINDMAAEKASKEILIRDLTAENAELKKFRVKVQKSLIYRLYKWFRK